MLQKLGIGLTIPNIAAARSWYEKAKELGSEVGEKVKVAATQAADKAKDALKSITGK